MIVAEAAGALLAAAGVETAFGVVGSGNFHITNALVRHGVRYVAARHEGGAATMADAYSRMSGRLAVLTVHQGPGLTNALTGLAEAAKSRTPLLVLAAEVTEAHSNFFVDQAALATAVGALPMRLLRPEDALEALRVARQERRTVVLSMPLSAQAADAGDWQPLEARAAGLRADISRKSGTGARPPLEARAAGPSAAGAGHEPERRPVAGEGAGAGQEPERRPVAGEGAGAGHEPEHHPTARQGGAAAEAGASSGDGRARAAVRLGVAAVRAELARMVREARRPVFVAGRGARHARRELEELADQTGALLATSAVARGLFRGSPWDLDVSGGFATPLTAELIQGADLVVAWGCALNMWTTRHGTLIPPGARVAQIDLEHPVAARHVTVDLEVTGEVAEEAVALRELLAVGGRRAGYRSPELAGRIAAEGRWRAVPYQDETGEGRIDPRTLTIALDDLLPKERIVAPDSGNFMGYPSMLLDVPDEGGFCFTQAFQSIGLGLATAIGAALARPDRLPVAALGDGGALMGISELETVARLGLPMVIVVYDDEGYGAEVHHFTGHPHDTVTFPPADLAAIARGHGLAAITVTEPAGLAPLTGWLEGPRDRAILVHAKVAREHPSWWLEEAFKGH
ncbi:thiamine pyrophosphate-binding protein [Nonomuraea typhae]|uniref:Thiamine pyrophosphate-binding protein n=1 Tax=Nonomuraea typhae TaxID=2603600 RepID=A0ABW7YPB8_9ACTN